MVDYFAARSTVDNSGSIIPVDVVFHPSASAGSCADAHAGKSTIVNRVVVNEAIETSIIDSDCVLVVANDVVIRGVSCAASEKNRNPALRSGIVLNNAIPHDIVRYVGVT